MKTIVTVEGMMCMHCEKHVNEAVKKAFAVTDVASSHLAGQTVITSEEALDAEKLMAVIREAGYEPKTVRTEA
ncbi:MAG: heavy-metal-associated domain-containing protein [Lachnospiraceae bacterium]|nr:heavy-metal-associated domain-containing protein [Lachnospiraceae bacterium]